MKMNKGFVRFTSLAAVSLILAACAIALPPIDMSAWFGGETDGLLATRGEYSAFADTPVSVDDIPAFSRGGVGLDRISVDGGSLQAPLAVPVAPGQAGSPDELEISVYLSVDAMASATDGDLLLTLSIGVDEELQLVADSLTITAGIDDEVLSTALEVGSFYGGIVLTVKEDGSRVSGDWIVTIDGLTAHAVLSLL